ncbi:hypothetical protein [Flavobacterium sp. CSZ]|uniref:hypothetical protein n=1 Tax=Flavobacterium sp. CSZ TaxID=2783791 RepID=UPI00188DAEEE|nr:hypothetical protein [Flavobacterium sp. CSZ]MBF4486229.1 hypothetical protein [Flavobacterium sp. CSZ]
MSRDDFKKVTTDVLPKRVGYLCSNPDCRKSTIGANDVPDKSTSIGIAAHITAASPGGPRFDETLTTEQRTHIDNGIWLCSNCATLIDKDEKKYSIKLLNDWKLQAEQESIKKLKGDLHVKKAEAPFLEADLIWTNGGRYNQGYSVNNPKQEIDGRTVYDVSNHPLIYWEIEWKFNFIIYNNSSFPAINVSVESIGNEHFTYIDKLNKVNNIPSLQNIDLIAKYSLFMEGTGAEADEIMKHRIPEKFNALVLRLNYLDQNREEHITLLKFVDGELINEKLNH